MNITVLDANDNPPVFSQDAYNFTVDENAYNKILGRVTASDVDTNSDTIYRIVGDAGPFIIGSDDGMLYKLLYRYFSVEPVLIYI